MFGFEMFIKIAVQCACADYIYLQDLLKQRCVRVCKAREHPSILKSKDIKFLSKTFLVCNNFFCCSIWARSLHEGSGSTVMVKGVVVSSWWVVSQVLSDWHISLLLLWLLLLRFLLWGLLWSSWDVVKVMNVMVSVHHVGIMVDIVVNIIVMAVWESVVNLMVALMMVIMWNLVVVLMSMWVILMG